MIKLTVLYNLQAEVDEQDFIKWRLTEHHRNNLAIPGVVRTDFSLVTGTWPQNAKAAYRFITTLDWPDWQSFQRGFYAPEVQAKLKENIKKLSNPVYLISEILVEEEKHAHTFPAP